MSDMNACIIHILSFLKAKWLCSYKRHLCKEHEELTEAEVVEFSNAWLGIFAPLLTSDACRESLLYIAEKEKFFERHAAALVNLFEAIGNPVLSG